MDVRFRVDAEFVNVNEGFLTKLKIRLLFRCIKDDPLPGAILPTEEELNSTTENGGLEPFNREEETDNKKNNAEQG